MRDSDHVYRAVESIKQQVSNVSSLEIKEWAPETIAFSIIALESSGMDATSLIPLRRFLTRWQSDQGAVLVDPSMQHTFWPTAYAILAWENSAEFQDERENAVRFLLRTTGAHWPKVADSATAHDTALKGWPWIEGTHSWIQPTAIAILAIDTEGPEDSHRVSEAVQMILDRQLPNGGWNYGSTQVFRNTTRPLPEETGLALASLKPHVERKQIEASVRFLAQIAPTLRAPAALAWSLLGLAAWDARPANARELIERSLRVQSHIGPYSLRYIAQLVIADSAKDGFASLFHSQE